MPAGVDALPPEVLAAPTAPPPSGSRASAVLRVLARVALWTLVAVGALRGLLTPAQDAVGPGPGTGPVAADREAAVAVAFLREYLTVDGDAAGRAGRLARFTAAGVELAGSVSARAGTTQYVDQVVASEVRPVDGGTEVTLLAHVLQLDAGGYRDGGTLAFVVPLAGGAGGHVVRAAPRPAPLPVAGGRRVGRPGTVPAGLAVAAAKVARQAVVAVVRRDAAELARLGGGTPPVVRPLPHGWRPVGVGGAEVTGPVEALEAHVTLRARAAAGVSYLVPVQVRLEARARGVTVREVDAGGPA